jgi:hypothetical protein
MDENKLIGKKRNISSSINISNSFNNNNINNDNLSNSTQNSDSTKSSKKENNNILYNEGIVLKEHIHWINIILILNKQPNHNLISSSADGQIIVYDEYPNYQPLLKMKLFGDSGVTYITELKNGTLIACSFGAIKQIVLTYNKYNNQFNYDVINYFVISTSYISKCIELKNENLVLISQQNEIVILHKNKNKDNNNEKGIKDIFDKKILVPLLKYEICINILELKEDLIISGSLTDPKYTLIEKYSNKLNMNYINFYDDNFNTIKKIEKIYCTKSHNNIVKINEQYVIVGIELSSNNLNWNNNKGIALIDYNSYEIISFYELANQVSSMLFYENHLYIGDNKGYLEKLFFNGSEFLSKQKKRTHCYNINSISCEYITDKNTNEKLLVIITGSNDTTIKITSFLSD